MAGQLGWSNFKAAGFVGCEVMFSTYKNRSKEGPVSIHRGDECPGLMDAFWEEKAVLCAQSPQRM